MADPITVRRPLGLANVSPERRREIASMGGKAGHASGFAHEFTSEEARAAGLKSAAVRAARRTPMTDGELEAHIVSLGALMERAFAQGEKAHARELQQCMYAAIAARSPAKQAAMEAAIQRRIDEGVDYFQVEGARAAAQIGARAA